MRGWSKGSLQQLDAYLEAVAAVMRESGTDEGEIDAVVTDLRDQALELAEAQRDAMPSADATMDAVIAELDDPASFRALQPGAAMPELVAPADPRSPLEVRLGQASAVLAPVCVVMAVVFWMSARALGTLADDIAGAIYVFGEIIALVAGFVGRRTTAGRFGMFTALLLLVVIALMIAFDL